MFAQKRTENPRIYHSFYVLGHCYSFADISVLNTGSVKWFCFLQVWLGNDRKTIDELHSTALLIHTLLD